MPTSDSENSWAEKDFDNVQHDVKGRQFFRRRPRRAADVLSQLMARKGYGQTKSKENLDEAWQIAVGPRFTSHRSQLGFDATTGLSKASVAFGDATTVARCQN